MARRSAALFVGIVSVGLLSWALGLHSQQLPSLAHLQNPYLVEQTGSARSLVVEVILSPKDASVESELLPAKVVGRIAPLEEAVYDRVQGAFRHQWPAIYAAARFEGDAITLAFDDPINRYRIELDKGEGPVVQIVKPETRSFRLSGLGHGPHSIRIDKISESASSTGMFRGFHLSSKEIALLPPPMNDRQISFIGDSDTVGLGNMSPSRDCEGYDVFLEATDTLKSFGPQVAAHFHADYEVIAASGIHLSPSASDVDGQTMLDLYPRTLPDDGAVAGQSTLEPDLVVILIGSNDVVQKKGFWGLWQNDQLPTDFHDSYLRLLQDVQAENPNAYVLLVALEEYGPDFVAAHRDVVMAQRSLGQDRIDLLLLPQLERTACAWHPSQADHQKIAEKIIHYIEAMPDIW